MADRACPEFCRRAVCRYISYFTYSQWVRKENYGWIIVASKFSTMAGMTSVTSSRFSDARVSSGR